MAGYIRQRKRGVWQVIVHVGKRPDGTEHRVSRTVHGSRRDAERARAELVLEVDAGRHRPTEPMSVPDLIDRRIRSKEPDWSPATTRTARQRLRVHHQHAGLPVVQKLRPHHIDAWYTTLRESGQSPASVRKIHADLTAALNQAVRWDLIASNPATRVELPKVPRSEIRVPTDDQVRRLIAAADDDLAAWIRLAATTGHRAGTLAALRWSDIDLADGSVMFARAITRGDQGLVEKGTKADRADRVTLDPHTTRALAAHRARMAERALAVGATLAPGAFVFSAEPDSGRPRDPNNASHRFTALRRQVGLPGGITLHSLRHYAATRMLAAGIPAPVVADRLGASTRVIEGTYRHFMPGQDQAAADLMGDALGGG